MLALCLIITAALAQPELRLIDAGTSDVSVNSESRLLPRLDQRKPVGFNQIYEMIKPSGERVFIRISGNTFAEFERSVYNASGGVEVSPGTVFRTGNPLAEQPTEVAPAPNRVSLAANSAPTRSDPARVYPSSGTVAQAVGEPSIIGNELYRRVRVSQLLLATVKPQVSEP